jgi:hypothetical protein
MLRAGRGVRGVTVDDVARVANQGSSGMRGGYTFSRPSTGPAYDPSEFAKLVIGGPAPTYGEKYGGYPTLGMLESAVQGIASLIPQAQQDALSRAAQTETDIINAARGELVFNPGTTLTNTYEDIRRRLETPMSANQNVASAQSRLADLMARKESFGAAEQGLETMQDYENRLRRSRIKEEDFLESYLPTRAAQRAEYADLQRLVQNAPAELGGTWVERSLAEAQARRDLRDASYADAMERRNAVALAGTQETQFLNPATGQIEIGMVTPAAGAGDVSMYDVARSQATPLVRTATGEQLTEQVDPLRQFAAELAATPMSQYQQQIATTQFGLDPALAAGLFGPQADINYMQEQMDLAEAQMKFNMMQAGFNPGATTEEIVFQTGGPDALAQYQQFQYESAMEKANEGPATAEEEAFDLDVANNLGVSVKSAAGDLPERLAREALTDQEFVDFMAQSRDDLLNSGAVSIEEQKNIIRDLGSQYFEQTGDAVKAQILVNILMSFEFLQAYGG